MLGREPVVITHGGFRIQVTVWDNLGYHLYYQGSYEPDQTAVFKELLQRQKPSVFVDIGANIGYYSLTALVAGVSKVIAFEPSPDIADWIEANVRYNDALGQRFSLIRAAMSDESGVATFWVNRYVSNLGTGSLSARHDIKENTAVQVDCIKGDEYFRSFEGERPLIKMDIEGAELRALSGLRDTLRKLRPTLVIEVHPEYLREISQDVVDVLRILREAAFSVERVEGNSRVHIGLKDDIRSTCWIIATPEEFVGTGQGTR